MIKFFRRIRYNLMSENKTSKYFKYAIGEIILVVIGILIALQINNWNEDRKEQEKETEVLNQLQLDIEETLMELTDDIAFQQISFNQTDSIIFYDPETSKKDFVSYFMPDKDGHLYLDDTKLYPPKSTYENLKTIGFEIIQNSDLRLKVIDLYERELPRVEIWENLVYDYADRLMLIAERHFEKTVIASGEVRFALIPKDYNTFLALKEFQNGLLTYQNRRGLSINRYKDVKKQVEEILELLNKR